MPSLADLLKLLIPELKQLEQAEIDQLKAWAAMVSSPMLKAVLVAIIDVVDKVEQAAIDKIV